MAEYSLDEDDIVYAVDGKCFEITPHLWQQNKQQKDILIRYLAVPLQEDEHTLWLGIDDLTNLSACESFSFLTGKIVEPILLSEQDLKSLLQKLSPTLVEEPALLDFYQSSISPYSENQPEKLDEPIIQILNKVFESAMQLNASDIHLEPQNEQLQIRFRIDGVLQHQPPISKQMSQRLISRLKLLARLDLSETRLPQDGRFHFKTTFSDILDFRISTLPTYYGEKAVLRLQKNKPVTLDFSELGMTAIQRKTLQNALSQPQGLILVTGPTGSGKSITLYTALEWLNQSEKHILTAEDPIEIELPGIIQTQINPQIGLDFNRLLRTFLRQDPDIIMLGEIRDAESAAIALRAAQTGHLVLSTLHTNNAHSAIARLLQLGIQQYEIESCLLLVIAQRLVRKKCLHKTKNCECYQGYSGRTGIYQFLQAIFDSNTGQISYQTDYPSLWDSASHKIAQGITDIAELERVLGRHTKAEL
ncbi:GspE/PulE family protein [Avibacterium paragallinarum]|uniref:GspE/PulE family protein n=2 Tax=Avibacterium paragallinarum TaxID=728 RepID=A0A0F5F317_AVIPA|nr:GspE/PulE family protein [Avibacterium paragallinarum]KAA6209825.1 type II/IV secretion system protein [Avibacterium paragallinarum]KKB02567.1 protein transporter HofB [Avibacterium paragallinarum]MEE3609428.1 GspE/PulE family protein [Avibacterium paragallinarum]MEE3620974.1 GspE/PulE family protein [Avibacterium paragallinarum]MEE3668733.1 GspE/PulE family protein [Avibacterium paragallinarum]